MVKELPSRPFVVACENGGIKEYYCGKDKYRRPVFCIGQVCCRNIKNSTRFYRYRNNAEKIVNSLNSRYKGINAYVVELREE